MKGYASSDHLELVDLQERMKSKQQELDMREFKLSVQEKLLLQDRKIEGYRQELKNDIEDLREKYSSLRQMVISRFDEITVRFDAEISTIKDSLLQFKTEFQKDLQSLRKQLGDEVLRIDRNHLQVVTHLERYANKVEHYRKETEYIKKEAAQMRKDSQFILKRAEHQFRKVQWQEKKTQDTLKSFQGKMMVDFQKQKLLLDDISMKQHHALKDIAYERMGAEVLNREVSNRMAIGQSKLDSTRKDIARLERDVKTQRALLKYDFFNNQRTRKLEDELFFAKERLSHYTNSMSMMKSQINLQQVLMNVQGREQRLASKGG